MSLEHFLQQQAEAGEAQELSREFSVNLIAAHQKMGQYSLPRSTAWLLKFVQAATEAKAPSLDLTLGKKRVEIQFPKGSFEALFDLRERLRTLTPKQLAEDHLFGGLLALHSLPGQVYVEHGDSRWFPAEERDIEETENFREGLRVVYLPERRSFWQMLRARIWFTAGLSQELQENCYGCPVELKVDQRSLHLGHGDIPLLSGLIKGEAGADLDYYGQLERETGNKNRTFCSWGSSRPQQIGYAIQLRLAEGKAPGMMSMEWVRSGVIVQRESVKVPGSLPLITRILVPTRGLQFDATGFAVKNNQESRERCALGSTYLEHAVEAVKGDLARERRWEKFLDRCYPERAFVEPHRLIEQLEDCVAICKRSFSRQR